MTARIGISTYRDKARWGVWDELADLLPTNYADAVVAAGGAPLLIPPTVVDLAGAEAVLAGLHGLVLAGGADVDPARYGARRDPETGAARPDRDVSEALLARAALAGGVPLLAVCRGMQVLNVALGGSLVQHLPDLVGHEGHCPTPGLHGRHDVSVADGTRLGSLLGSHVGVATYHHQAVADLGRGLVATAWAADGTVEGVELEEAGWTVGVQWHPEVADGGALFAGFVSQCEAFAAGQPGDVAAARLTSVTE
jgi:putative glutamine amidotransferase